MLKIKNFYLRDDIENESIQTLVKINMEKIESKIKLFKSIFKLNLKLIEISTISHYKIADILSYDLLGLFFKDFSFELTIEPEEINQSKKTKNKTSKLKLKLKDNLSFTITGSNTESDSANELIAHFLNKRQLCIDFIYEQCGNLLLEHIQLKMLCKKISDSSINPSFLAHIYKKNIIEEDEAKILFDSYVSYLKSNKNNEILIPFLTSARFTIYEMFSFSYNKGFKEKSQGIIFTEDEFFKLFKNSFYFNNRFYICYDLQDNNFKELQAIMKAEDKNKNFPEKYFTQQEINNF